MIEPEVVRRPIGDNVPEATLYYGADCRETMRGLPEQSVHTVVTSPPYFGLRDYGTGDAQIGLEGSPEKFIESLVEVFREVRRVLRDDGTLWLNLGDSYASGAGGGPSDEIAADDHLRRNRTERGSAPVTSGLKPKDLVGIPWMVAFALRADGWYLRSDIIWAKSSCMPESIRDRPTKAHEYLFLLTKQPVYFYDSDAIRERSVTGDVRAPHGRGQTSVGGRAAGGAREGRTNQGDASTRNKRTVWHVNPKPYPGAHFAVFPPELITPCILAGASEKGCCPECGAPWERVVTREALEHDAVVSDDRKDLHGPTYSRHKQKIPGGQSLVSTKVTGQTWRPTCGCDAGDPVPCTVMDPFSGSGTAGQVALDHGRAYVGLDLNTDYLDLARARILGERPPSKPQEDDDASILEFFS